MNTRNIIIFTVICTFLLGGAAWGATDTQNLTINATVAASASLKLTPSVITFPNSDPDTVLSIPSSPVSIDVETRVKTGSSGTVNLTVLANGDLSSTVPTNETIAISNVTWTATGTGFIAGTMNKTTAQSAGTWTGSGRRDGTFSYFLANSWSHPVGTYSATATYTLTAP
jgi:hypothetical protein